MSGARAELWRQGGAEGQPASRARADHQRRSQMFVLDLACRKAQDLSYPARSVDDATPAEHVRECAPAVGYACVAHLAEGTLCKILAAQEIKPHKVRNYLERRDPEFDAKMAEVLAVYREVEQLKQAAEREGGGASGGRNHLL